MTSSSPAKASSRAKTDTVQAVAANYEAALQELEQLVSRLDSGQLPLDQLLTQYQRGAELLAFCRARLQAVEDQVKVMEAGQAKPWSEA
ncbi:MAG: exodeoxyribonuclease VII small subunit [Hydrogenophaga sp.]